MQKFKMFIIDALKSLKRNKTITFASIITVAATLFIFGVFLIVAQTINMGVESVESKVEIKAYLIDEITTQEQSNMRPFFWVLKGSKRLPMSPKRKLLISLRKDLAKTTRSLQGSLKTGIRCPIPLW